MCLRLRFNPLFVIYEVLTLFIDMLAFVISNYIGISGQMKYIFIHDFYL